MRRLLPALLFFIILFSSCQQTELEFSCDPVINNFVKEKQSELSVLTLDQFLDYDLPLQKAIYNSWDVWKKRNIWIEKLERIAIRDSLKAVEVEHIQQLIEHIHSDYFLEENMESEKVDRSLFAKQWINDAKNNLEWTDKFIAFIVYRLYTDEDQFENELSKIKSLEKSVSTSAECICNQSADFCGNANCLTNGCDTGSGCGWLWSMDCNGLCIN